MGGVSFVEGINIVFIVFFLCVFILLLTKGSHRSQQLVFFLLFLTITLFLLV